MKFLIPILLAFILLLTAVSFARAEAASAAVGSTAAAEKTAPTLAHLTSTVTNASAVTTTSVITPVDLSGVIIYGSGADLPEALSVTLYAYQPDQSAMNLFLTATTTTRPDGAFTFKNVAGPGGSVFMASSTYADVPYHSAPSMGEPMTITVFEAITNADQLVVSQMHLIFDFSATDVLQMMEVYILTNVGNQTVVAGADGKFMVDFPLPQGAQTPEYRSGLVGEPELDTNDGFWEILAVRPNSMYGVSYVFSLPYPGKMTLSQPIELPVSSVSALLPESGTLSLNSADLVDNGPSDIGGASYRVYTGQNLSAGSLLDIKISGDPNASQTVTGKSRSWLGLIIGPVAFGLALILAGVWLSRRSRQAGTQNEAEFVEGEELSLDEDETDTQEDAETLMDDIIALDDLYQADELPEAAYRERRAELKAKLRAIVEDENEE